ncbi:uncharacterized protein [Haliotis cracherodii]|uniref:uncharacterized protein n=1 Tax=Haliotis cracherodii TaxID=6455 RepID=UPI0039EAA4D5
MKVAFLCLSLVTLWAMSVSEDAAKATVVEPQQIGAIVAYDVPGNQVIYRPPTTFYKPGISDLKSVGGVKGLLSLGLHTSQYRPPGTGHRYREYLPATHGRNQYGQNLANQNPYDKNQFDQRPYFSRGPIPYSSGQRYHRAMGNSFSGNPTSLGGTLFPQRPLNNYKPSYVLYKPGVKDLKRYGGIEGLLRLGLPSILRNH